MTFQDIFKRSFLEGWANTSISVGDVVVSILFTTILAGYIFFVYRAMTKETFYSKNFNIALAGVSVITASIIITIHSSIMVSLGMVGALSIVRFRTAVKDPIDLMFLFWSISVGIICGAGHAEYAVILCIVLTVGLFALQMVPVAKAPLILVINATADDMGIEEKVVQIIQKYAKSYRVKARNLSKSGVNLTIEMRSADGQNLVREIVRLKTIQTASLLEHDGEAVF